MIVTKTTGWCNPSKTSAENKYGRNTWTNLASIQYWDDDNYAFVDDGVTKEVISDNLFITGFGFNVPSTATIKEVSIRLRVLDNTVGGGDIIDDWLRLYSSSNPDGLNIEENSVKINPWSDKETSEIIYTSDKWLKTSLTPSQVNNNDFGFVYRCRGTNEHGNKPFIYGVQAKVDYTVEETVDPTVKAQYKFTATTDKTVFPVNDSATLTLTRECTNNVAGTIGKTTITLSDELVFSDNTRTKTINGGTTTPSFKQTTNYTIIGKNNGVGSITISSGSLASPIRITILVDTGTTFKDKLISLNSCTFNTCKATERGGGYYNANNCIHNNLTFNNCHADIKGDNYYDAKTQVNFTAPTPRTAEVNIETSVPVKISFYETPTEYVDRGVCHLYVDNTYHSTVEVGSKGDCVFTWKPLSVGNSNLRVVYESNSSVYANSEASVSYTVSKSNTSLRNKYVVDTCPGTGNVITRGDFYEVTLYDSNNKPLIDKPVDIIVNGLTYTMFTDTTGTAYLQVNLLHGEYTIKSVFNGDTDYEACSLTHCLKVSKVLTVIEAEDTEYYYTGVSNPFNLQLNDVNNNNLASMTVDVNLSYYDTTGALRSMDWSKVTDGTGKVRMTEFPSASWLYYVKSSFNGTNDYEACVKKNLYVCYAEGDYETSLYLDESSYSVSEAGVLTVTGYMSKFYTTHNLKVIISDSERNVYIEKAVSTNNQGKYSVTIDTSTLTGLVKGEYLIEVYFLGDDFATGTKVVAPLTVNGGGTVPTLMQGFDYISPIKSNTYFDNYLYREDTMAGLSNTPVNYTIYRVNAGLQQHAKTVINTNTDGKSRLPLTFSHDGYVIEARYTGDNTFKDCYSRNTCIIQYNSPSTAETLHYAPYRNVIGLYKEDGTLATDIHFEWCYITFKNVLTNQYECCKTSIQEGNFYQQSIDKPGVWKWSWDWLGNDNYKPLHQDQPVMVTKSTGKSTRLELNDYEFYKGENVDYTLYLKDKDGLGVSSTVVLYINGEYYPVMTDDTGKGVQSLNSISEGVHTATVYYPGEDGYASCQSNSIVIVNHNTSRVPVILNVSSAVIKSSTDTGVKATLTNALTSNPITNAELYFYLEGKSTKLTTDSNGEAEFKPSLPHELGTYNVNVQYIGTDTFESKTANTTVTFELDRTQTQLLLRDTSLVYGAGNVYVRLYDKNGNGLSGKSVGLVLVREGDGKSYSFSLVTDGNGEARLDTSTYVLKAGVYDCSVSFSGDSTYASCNGVMGVVVTADITGTTSLVPSSTHYVYSFIDTKKIKVNVVTDNPVSDEVLSYTFTGSDGTRSIVNGVITTGVSEVISNLDSGEYTVDLVYNPQSNYPYASEQVLLSINPTVCTVTSQGTSVRCEEYYRVNVKDTGNNPVVNQFVVFKITDNTGATVYYNSVTDNNGVARVLMNYTGTFTVTSKLAGNKNFTGNVLVDTVTVNPR